MAFDYLSSISSFNLNELTNGASTTSPLPDVSWAAPAMESATPTGNGSGQFLDTATQNGLFGALDKVLNYAISRDSAKIQQDTAIQLSNTQAGSVNTMLAYQAQQSASNRKLLLMGAAVAALFLVMRK